MLCVYLRPWTLKPQESTRHNPLLSVLGKCVVTTEADIPAWTQLAPLASTETTTGDAEAPGGIMRRRRTKSKPDSTTATEKHKYSYATSWGIYIDGNVVSDTSRRFIVNLLAATAATQAEKQEDSSGDSDEEAWHNDCLLYTSPSPRD